MGTSSGAYELNHECATSVSRFYKIVVKKQLYLHFALYKLISFYDISLVGLCIHPIERKHWSELLKILTRTSCLGNAKCIIFYIYLRRKEIILIFFRHFVEHPAKIFTWLAEINKDFY